MQDICQIIIEYIYDIDTLKSLYLSSDIFRELLNSKSILLKLTNKFNIVSNSNKIECFKDFIDKHGTLLIPNKSKHKEYDENGSYFTRNNGDRLFNVRINNGIVNVHTEGRIVTDSEEDEDYYPSDDEDNYSIEPFMTFYPKNIFIGKDPFNNHEDFDNKINYNPNINDDPNFCTYEHFKNKCFVNDTDEELDEDDIKHSFEEYKFGFYYDIDRSCYDGSNILLHIKDYDYIYISYKLYAFTAVSKIVNFISIEGNADVPYPYAIDEYNNVYLFSIDSTDIKNQEGVIIMMDKDHLKYLQGKSDSDYYHMNPYNYYFFTLTDKEKSGNTKYKPICSTIEYFNGMSKYGKIWR